MYCSTCGVGVTDGLSYCNRCGARITSNIEKSGGSREFRLVSAMVTTFVVGILAITVLLGVLKAVLGLESGQILGFAALCFLIMIFLEGVFLRLLLRRDPVEERATAELTAGHSTKELGAPTVQTLQEPVSSVTDHTTRAFEPIYSNRNKTT